MNVVYLIGKDTVLSDSEYPLFLMEVDNKTILETQIEKFSSLSDVNIIFCVKKEIIKKYNFDYLIHELLPNAKLVALDGDTQGALCSALMTSQYVNNEEELVLLAINDFVDSDYNSIVNYFRNEHADAGVVSFHSIHPRYSYVRLNDKKQPLEFCEKKTISKNALASFYYLKKGSDFIEAAKNVIRKDSPENGAFYISMAYNELILSQKSIAVYQIPNNLYHPLKNEMELARYITDYKEREIFK
ncbi:MAG: hypothetical protein ACI4V7_10690 [Succinivibrionaceae bacterium]